MKHPLISVIIPCYNEEKYLPQALGALKKQTYPNYEIIVIDNNCTDSTSVIAEDAGVKVVRETSQGMIPARQRGFREAKGEIVARIDADCVPETGWLEAVRSALSDNPEAVAVFGPAIYTDNGKLMKLSSFLSDLLLIFFTRLVMGHWQLTGGNHAVKKDVIGKIKPHLDDAQVHEDIDLSCHVFCYGEIVFKPKLIMATSSRRVRNDPLYIFKGLHRLFKTLALHHPSHKLHQVS